MDFGDTLLKVWIFNFGTKVWQKIKPTFSNSCLLKTSFTTNNARAYYSNLGLVWNKVPIHYSTHESDWYHKVLLNLRLCHKKLFVTKIPSGKSSWWFISSRLLPSVTCSDRSCNVNVLSTHNLESFSLQFGGEKLWIYARKCCQYIQHTDSTWRTEICSKSFPSYGGSMAYSPPYAICPHGLSRL